MAVTIREVAKEAGVSTATISRVINSTGQIKPSTKKTVVEAIRRTGYAVPSPEKSLSLRKRRKQASGKKRRIAFLVPDVAELAMRTVLTGQLLNGINSELQANGIETIFTKLSSPDTVPGNISPGQIEGLIVKNWISSNILRKALERFPHVVCLETKEPELIADQVHPDTEKIAHMALSHFLERGIKRIVAMTDVDQHPQKIRGRTFCSMAGKAGCDVRNVDFNAKDHSDTGRAIKRFFELAAKQTGLFISADDLFTTQFYMAMRNKKISADGTVEIVTIVDNPSFINSIDRRISTIDLRADEIGRTAARTLLWRLQNPVSPQMRIQITPKFSNGEERA